MNKYIIITSLFVFLISFTNVSFWYSWNNDDKIETIRDLKDNLNDLNNKNTTLNFQINKAIKKTWQLKSFFREDLTLKELSELKEVFDLYKIYSDRINKAFDENIKNSENTDKSKLNLLKEKAWVYKRLTPYIRRDKLRDFLSFIKSDLNITKKKKDIEEDLYFKKNTLNKKVAIIKEKIVEHKKALDEKLEKIIVEKVAIKIAKLKNSINFKKLPYNLKKKALNNVISKIEIKINSFKANISNLNKKKLELYKIIKFKLEELNNSITE